MEYNTQREQLKIADYGRNVLKLVEYTKQLEKREERTAMANVIIDVMAHLNPKIKERTDYKHILWDHLMMLADYGLDVDCPYEINRDETGTFHPHALGYSEGQIRYRHYGRTLEGLIKAVAEMPLSEERTLLTGQIAHAMKRQYLQWNRDTVDDDVITSQLTSLSEGQLHLPDDFRYTDTRDVLSNMVSAQGNKADGNKKKKKKKKKNNAQ